MPASMLGFISPSCANTEKWSVDLRVWCLGPFSGFCLRRWSSVIERLQPKYQPTGVKYTSLYNCSWLQFYSAQPTLPACQSRGPRIKSQMCSGDPGNWTRNPPTPVAECVSTWPRRPLNSASYQKHRQIWLEVCKLVELFLQPAAMFIHTIFWCNRFYKLHTKGLCEVIPMTVPRKVQFSLFFVG